MESWVVDVNDRGLLSQYTARIVGRKIFTAGYRVMSENVPKLHGVYNR